MKVVSLRDAKAGLSEFVEKAQSERVLVTRHGKPAVLLIGVAEYEMEDLLTMANPQFWELIEASRKSVRTFSLDEVKKRFGIGAGEKRRVETPARKRSRRNSRVRAIKKR